MPTLVQELRRRGVFRVAAAYALVAWILIEAGSVLLPTFGAPEHAFRVYTIVVIAGWFVSLVAAWVYEVTPEGVRLERDVDRSAQRSNARPGWNLVIIGLLALALGVSITFNVTGIRNAGELPRGARDSIAVLPFENRSADPDNQYFTDGIHDDLLTRLADIEALRVISRTSVLAYRDTDKSVPEIGRELSVGVILEGSVQQYGDQVRIVVQLIDAVRDEHIWTETYDKNMSMESIFDIQSAISSKIAKELEAALTPEEEQRLATVPTKNIDAYRFYVAGRESLAQRRFESTQAARSQFEQAIAIDPEFAEAHAALAEATVLLMINHAAVAPVEAIRRATASVERALELDPDLAEAYAVAGLIEMQQWQRQRIGDGDQRAQAAFERAIDLSPNLASAYSWYASLKESTGDIEKAIDLHQYALKIDPRSRVPYLALPGLLAAQGKNDEATRLLLNAVDLFPEWSGPSDYLAVQLQRVGRIAEAIAWNRRSQALTDDPLVGTSVLPIYAELGMQQKLIEFTERIPPDHPLIPAGKGYIHFMLGNFDEALEIATDESLPEVWKFELGNPIAVRSAIITGDLEVAYRTLVFGFPQLVADEVLEVDRYNLDAVVLLGYLEQRIGNSERAELLLDAALAYMQDAPRFGMWGYGIRDVEALALRGRQDAAIDALTVAVDDGFVSMRTFELWGIDQTPLIHSLRNDPRYEALRNRIEARLERERDAVEQAERDDTWQALRDQTRRII